MLEHDRRTFDKYGPIERCDLTPDFHGRGGQVNPRRRSSDGRDHHGDYVINGKKLARPFMTWDGEGITYVEGKPQSYVLFGCSSGDYIVGESLSTADCLALIMRVENEFPHVIHVGFSFKYDVEMILADLPIKSWYYLRKHGIVRWKGYRITYHPGKRFTVSKWNEANTQRTTATIYDVWGFFQSSFIAACRGWLEPHELAEIDRVEEGKAKRGTFTTDELMTYVFPYWQSELGLLARLVNRLRERLTQAGVLPSSWHGPGAIATTIYREHKVREHMSRTMRDAVNDSDIHIADLPDAVNEAAQYAYSAGHFERFQIGHHPAPVYQYDINSAYPAAISALPSLKDGQWERDTSGTFDPQRFGMWRIEFDCWQPSWLAYAFPLFYRDERRCVSYPMTVTGWYWTPEAALVAGRKDARITESWTWHANGPTKYPFAFVLDMYTQRQQWKAEGNPAEKALKLSLNSLYGKMAQRAGWQDKQPLPRFHQLEWAGYVTSYTRAVLYRAMNMAGPGLVAVETDAVFSTVPLPKLPISKQLGDWDLTEHEWITYLSSGTYWTDRKAAYRGLDPDSLTHDDAIRWLRNGMWRGSLTGRTTRFIGSGRGLGTPLHRCWVTETRELRPGMTGKRIHMTETCPQCERGISPADALHSTIVATRGGESQPHLLPWLIPDDPFSEEIRAQALAERYDHVFCVA
jgi:hypothetical protein